MENQFISLQMAKEAKKDAKRIILNSNCENIKAGSKYPCTEAFNCCDCGGNECGCAYCFSCNACDYCKEN